MRTRLAVLVAVLGTLVTVATPGVASAAPLRNHGLTINVTPNPIVAGQGVLIYGQLNGVDHAGQTIYLYHRVVPAAGFTLIQKTTTGPLGFYDFVRNDGIVVSNRSWFVRGPGGTHSRTVNERVAALVTLRATPVGGTTTVPVTGQTILLAGHVTPLHAYQPILIQKQNGVSGNNWSTIAMGFTDASSNFSIPHAWAQPGIYTLRAVFKGDPRNITGDSDLVTVTIEQRQNPAFTITSSSPTITYGQPVTISGILYEAASATPLTTNSTTSTSSTTTPTPEPSTLVTLYGKTAGGTWQQLATTTTATDGSYSFLCAPTSTSTPSCPNPVHNTVYQVRTTLTPVRSTASLYEGVQDVVTITGSGVLTATVGETITLTGTVQPDHTGHVIYLQSLGSDHAWHNVETGVVATGSTYSFTYAFGEAGTFQLRARIYGGPENVGAALPSVTVTVSGVAPIATLTPAS
jgi:hypothetical protein